MHKKLAAVVVAVALSPLSASAAADTYSIDPFHSFLHFEVDHLAGVSKLRGRFDKTAGKFTLDQAAKTGSLDVTIQSASVSTGDSDKGTRARSRDEHGGPPISSTSRNFRRCRSSPRRSSSRGMSRAVSRAR